VIEWDTKVSLKAEYFDVPERHGNMIVIVDDPTISIGYEGNVIVDGKANQITLSYGKPFRNPVRFTAKKVSFSREFNKKTKIGTVGGWEAMVLPFRVQTITSETKGDMKPFGETSIDSSLPYWIAQLQDDGTFAYIDEITANKPFIMEVPNSDEYEDKYNIQGTVTFVSKNITIHPTTVVSSNGDNGFTLMGSYEGVTAANCVYALNDAKYKIDNTSYMPGGLFVENSRDIRPFEAYIYNNQPSRAPYLRIEGKATTDIEQLMQHIADDGWYTLQGVRLSDKPTEKGVYIHCRRVVYIR
jgi:hypothetical protein